MSKRKIIILVGSSLLVACLLLLAMSSNTKFMESDPSQKSNLVDTAILSQYPAILSIAIKRVIYKNGLTDNEFDKISFAKPGDDSYGSQPLLEIFNKGGGAPIVNVGLLKDVATHEYSVTFSNILEGAGTNATDLIAVLPGVHDDICRAVHQNYAKFILKVSKKEIESIDIPVLKESPSLLLSPELKEPAVILPELYEGHNCVKGADGVNYYYQLLLQR